MFIKVHVISKGRKGKGMLYLTTHSSHFIYGYMSSDVIRITMSYVNIIMNCQFFELFFLYVGARYSLHGRA